LNLLRRFQPIVYVQLHPDMLSVREVRSGRSLREPPVAAISRPPKRRLPGVGRELKDEELLKLKFESGREVLD
jgi:hypothetical protein